MAEPFLGEQQIRVLRAIARRIQEDPNFLEQARYPEDIKRLFGMGNHVELPDLKQVSGKDLSNEEIGGYVTQLLSDMEAIRARGLEGLEPATINTYFRVATALTQKLIDQREKLHSIDKARRFMRAVIEILEDTVPENVAGEFVERVRKVVGGV